MRRFYLQRDEDVSGVSGTGIVAQGVEFNDTLIDPEAKSGSGKVVINWFGVHRSVVIWDSIEDALVIHGHDGRTKVVWMD